MVEKTDIFVTGIGGQGSLSASTYIGQAATKANLKVIVGEIHGMAQRGGIVESTVRIGDIHGPILDDGGADILLGFEPVETLRAINKANPDAIVVMNTHPIVPLTVSIVGGDYPSMEYVLEFVRKRCKRIVALDATKMALEAGNALAQGTVLLGVLSGIDALPFDSSILEETVLNGVPKKTLDVNKKAFAMGLEFGKKAKADNGF